MDGGKRRIDVIKFIAVAGLSVPNRPRFSVL